MRIISRAMAFIAMWTTNMAIMQVFKYLGCTPVASYFIALTFSIPLIWFIIEIEWKEVK